MLHLETEMMANAMSATHVFAPSRDPAGSSTLTVKSRFGDYEVSEDRLLTLPHGVIGFGAHRSFALLNLPEGKGEYFKLLQSVDDPSLAFYVLPAMPETSGYDLADLAEAQRNLEIADSDLLILLLVTARRGDAGTELTVNLRAPLLIDASRRTGHQYVMANDNYSLRHPLS